MRIVLDTNVLASGLFFSGIPLKILEGIKQGKCRIVVTEDILDEYKKTIDKLANNFPEVDANDQLEVIVLSSEICQPKKLVEPICEDPDDDMFVACALAGSVEVIVSGDKHLLDISGFHNIEVLKPRVFFERYM